MDGSVPPGVIWRPGPEYREHSRVADFMRRQGIATGEALVKRSVADIEWFWTEALRHLGVPWQRPYDRLLDRSGGLPWTRWFVGGRLNIADVCLDRHVREGRGGAIALRGESDDGTVVSWTYRDLSERVSRAAGGLRTLGVRPGDAVGIYMPMVPEVVVAFFACLKAGAVAVPVFSAFGPEALAVRLRDAGAKILLTADGGIRRGKEAPIKPNADLAVAAAPSVEKVVVLRRTGTPVPLAPGRDIDWHAWLAAQPPAAPAEETDAEAPAMILYTSGTTGRPKGTVHTHGGSLATIAKELGYAFDVRAGDVFFWFTDIGWMMGPWEMIGVSFHGGTTLVYEGTPNHPAPDRLWQVVERHGVTHLGVSPTAVRLLRTHGDEWVDRHPMPTLRILGSTGEPWDPESYLWFFEKAGRRRCPILNISGGTELVGCLLSPLPVSDLKPCTLGGPGLGVDADVFDDDGRPVRGKVGQLVCKQPVPSMTRGFLGDRQRYLDTYFSRGPDVWYHGDWAIVDADGFWFLQGRSDDTIKIAGKRIGPAEVESALVAHPAVAEGAAVGVPHDLKGETVACFCVLRPGHAPSKALQDEIAARVVASLGKTVRPEAIEFVPALPKTRSAKIVRGAIRRRYLGLPPGDLASVENPEALAGIPQRSPP